MVNPNWVKGMTPWNKGLKGINKGVPRHAYDAAFRKKISQAFLGRKLSDKHKTKIGASMNGRIIHRGAKISKAQKGKKKNFPAWNKGLKGVMPVPWNKGIKGYMGANATSFKKGDPRITGKNSPNWKGGVTPEVEKIRKSKDYINWRNKVYERDNFTCQECGQHGGDLHAHHVFSFSEYPALRLDLENGQTTCKDCHIHIHQSYKRQSIEVS